MKLANKRLFIYCAGGFGREVLRLAREINIYKKQWDNFVFIDDDCRKKTINGAEVWGFSDYTINVTDCDEIIIAAGETNLRKKLVQQVEMYRYNWATLIHPDFRISPYNLIGECSVITEGVIFTDNIKVGKYTHLNLNCTVGHDCCIGDFVTVSPGAIISGNVTIGDGTYIGAGAVIRDEITIGKNCIIGMGSLVTKDIPDNVVAYGTPCRVIRPNTDGIVFK